MIKHPLPIVNDFPSVHGVWNLFHADRDDRGLAISRCLYPPSCQLKMRDDRGDLDLYRPDDPERLFPYLAPNRRDRVFYLCDKSGGLACDRQISQRFEGPDVGKAKNSETMITIFLLILVAMAICALETNNLINAVIMLAVFSLIMSMVFYYLKAPDVAMAEAAVGAGVSTVIFVIAIHRTGGGGR